VTLGVESWRSPKLATPLTTVADAAVLSGRERQNSYLSPVGRGRSRSGGEGSRVRGMERFRKKAKALSRYSPMVRMTLLSGRVLFDDSLSCCVTISSYFGMVVSCPFGTMCTTL
jgi:hypothetical protein